MIYPTLTAFYAGMFGVLFIVLSLWVAMGRVQYRTHHGDGGHEALRRRIRAQANFTEYVPLALLLIGLNEWAGTESWIVRALLIALFIGRIIHPFGIIAPVGSVQQYALRAPGMMLTWSVILIASVLLLMR